MKIKKSELKAKLRSLFIKEGVESNSLDFFKTMQKKELKNYINQNGGFTKGTIQKLEFSGESVKSDDQKVPEGAFYFEAVLSDESINMNGYRILLDAWKEGFATYFSDFEGLNYLMHDMDLPIGKTLEIGTDDTARNLWAKGFAYDDLTEKRVSRGLVRDISTGHIPLEIKYINKDTGEEKTPSEFFNILWDMVDRMWGEGKSREEIEQSISDLREIWVETHTKVQIVEYSFVSVGANKQAEVKKINNTIEKLNSESLEDVEIENDTEETPSPEGEITPNTTTEKTLENEGGTPEGSVDTTPVTEPEIVPTAEEENTTLKAENETLKNTITVRDSKIAELESKVSELTTDVSELTTLNTGKKKVVINEKSTENVDTEVRKHLANSCNKLLKSPFNH